MRCAKDNEMCKKKQFLDISLSIDIFFKDGVSKFLAQVHMRPKTLPVCLKAQRFVVILSAHK